MPFPHVGEPGYREPPRRRAAEVSRSELDRIAAAYGHRPRWVSQMVESGYLPKPRLRSKGRGQKPEWVYPPGTDARLRALCRLHKMGYRRGALRFAWFYLIRGRHTPGAPLTPDGRWTAEAANYVAEVVHLTKEMHRRRADALSRDAAGQNAMATLNLDDTTAGDFTQADRAQQVAREVACGNTPADRLKRVIVARELGLLAGETGENPGRLLGALAEEQAEAFDQFREASDGKRYATPFHPNGPIRLLPTADHDLGEYAKTLVKTGGAASPFPSGFAALDPIGRERRQLWARVRGIRAPFEPAFDPDQLQNYLERDAMQRQYLINDAVVSGNLIENAEQIIRSVDANQANSALCGARRPDAQRERRRRVKEVADWLAQFSERKRGRQGIPSPGPALAERAKDVAGVILGEWVLRPGSSIA